MKKNLCLALIAVIMTSFVACGTNDKEINEDKKPIIEENTDNEDRDELEDENSNDGQEKPSEEKPSIEKPSTGTNTENNKKPEGEKEDKIERVFEILTMDVDYNTVMGGQVKTVGLGVADNIRKVLSEVSTKYFDKKPIMLTTIETIGNKKIAVVDLGGDSKYWNDKMQGSTGGKITEYTLIENVLQRSYNGYWIDGVRFTLNGSKIQDNGHTPELSDVAYRI